MNKGPVTLTYFERRWMRLTNAFQENFSRKDAKEFWMDSMVERRAEELEAKENYRIMLPLFPVKKRNRAYDGKKLMKKVLAVMPYTDELFWDKDTELCKRELLIDLVEEVLKRGPKFLNHVRFGDQDKVVEDLMSIVTEIAGWIGIRDTNKDD